MSDRTDSVARLFPLLMCIALLAGCATTAGLLGLGQKERTLKTARCEEGSEKTPLAKWGSISGNLLARSAGIPASGTPDTGHIRLTSPVAVAARANDLFIADAGQRAILKFDRGTQTVRTFASVPDMNVRAGLYIDRGLSLYLVDPVAAKVIQFDIDGKLLQIFENTTELPQPIAMVVNEGQQEIIIGDQLTAHILVFNRAGLVSRAIGASVTGGVRFQSIIAMTSGPDQLFVSDRLAHLVHALAPDGTYRYGFGEDELISPGPIAFDMHNRVYVADNGDNTIKVYRGGQLEAVVGASGDPVGLGFQQLSDLWLSDGLLYVADAGRASIDILRVVPPCQ
ncbi:MAG: NHL repeat-containing protein [Pseudomonadota bacterium]